jgi:hypothetical protein
MFSLLAPRGGLDDRFEVKRSSAGAEVVVKKGSADATAFDAGLKALSAAVARAGAAAAPGAPAPKV